MYHLSLVALGGAVGASCRHLVGMAALRLIGPGVPFGTLFVNTTGSLMMGLLVGALALKLSGGAEGVRLFLGTGVLGGYTTFSAFSMESVLLWERGDGGLAAAYVAGSVVLSLAALAAGLWLARMSG